MKLPRLIIYFLALSFCIYLTHHSKPAISKDAIVPVSTRVGILIKAKELQPLNVVSFVHKDIIEIAAPVLATPVSTGSLCGDNSEANYIYMHESGCDPTKWNSSGCVGIGQACPASKLEAACPGLDYACENAYFTAYASKYGGWSGAYEFWLANSWW